MKTENMKTEFLTWYQNNLTVGPYPTKYNHLFKSEDYDIVINMSDEFYFDLDEKISQNCKTFWFPMNEMKKDIGLNSIYAAMVILYNAEKQNKRVYLHCHAGVNRSQITKCAYYFLRTQTHLEETFGSFINALVASCTRGYLYPKNEIENFLTYLGDKLNEKNGVMSGGELDMCKLNTIK